MSTFVVIDMHTAEPVCVAGEPIFFATGREASAKAKELTDEYGRKFQPRPAPKGDTDWRARERGRFETGEYLECASALHKAAALKYPDHFLHVSKDKPELVAFIKSETMGEQDRQTRRTVRAYLEEFFPKLAASTRTKWAQEHVEKFALLHLKWAISGGEIERVYTTYVEHDTALHASCMRYEVGDNEYEAFQEVDQHPVHAYGNSDLKLAYLENDDGYTTARALVYEAKKVYSRVYGGAGSQLHALLQSAGYKKSSTYWSRVDHPPYDHGPSFVGARIRRIENEGRGGGWLMPYVDGVDHAAEDGKWFVLGRGNTDTDVTCGYVDGPERMMCPRCEEYIDEEDAIQVVVGFGTWGRERRLWCQSCTDVDAIYCEGYSEHIADRFASHEVGGSTYSEHWCEANLGMCEFYGEYMPQGTEFHQVVVRARDWTYNRYSTNSWSQQAVDDHAVWSEAAQMWFTLDKFQFDDVELIDGVRHGTPKNFDRGAYPWCENHYRF